MGFNSRAIARKLNEKEVKNSRFKNINLIKPIK